MSRDTQSKMFKKRNELKKEELKRQKKVHESSDDDTSFYTEDDEDEMDVHEYRKLLKKIFPSKHLDKKVKAGNRLKKLSKTVLSESESDSESELEEPVKKNVKKRNIKRNTNKHCVNSETEEDLEDDKPSKLNIIFTIGGDECEDESCDHYLDDDSWETCSGSETENEDDPISSDSEYETENDSEYETESEEDIVVNKRKSKSKSSHLEENKVTNIDHPVLNFMKDYRETHPDATPLDNKIIDICMKDFEDNYNKELAKVAKKEKKERDRNSRIFKKILRDKNSMNDFEFYNKMDIVQQKKIIKELREINKITRVEKPYRLTLLESDIPVIFKASAIKKINSLRYMEPGSGEYYKIKNWVDTFMRIPFNKYETLPLSITDGVDKCHDFMENAQKTLDEAVYGLNDAKMQIMQMLGQLITNPQAIGSAIAIHGPPGTGKTSLVKEGISKILNRPFAFIALGGATDSSFLEGHGYTYEGSTWGKIVQILIDSKCMNPVIYFDELDKISDTPKGEEIVGILTHLTDTSQNTQFHDKYFADIDFDLSKCLFIFSYNDETKVNPILKDRMYSIQTNGYNQKQKTAIANNYLLPKIRDQVRFDSKDIIIPDQTLTYIIENYCNKEDGVRNLKRCLEIIHTKLNLYRLMKPETNLFQEEMSLKVQFPFTVNSNIVDKLIKKTDSALNQSLYMLYV
jgi:ATP-dependent Lon protease